MKTKKKIPRISVTAKTFGMRLFAAAKEKGGPQQQDNLAKWFYDEYGITTSGGMLNRYKNNDEAPRVDKCRMFAMALDVAVEWLYTERGPVHPMEPLSAEEFDIVTLIRAIPDEDERRNWIGHMTIQLREQTQYPPAGIRRNAQGRLNALKGVTMAYRKRKSGSDTWHWCRNCHQWPTSDFEERQTKPSSGELCNHCLSKDKANNCTR